MENGKASYANQRLNYLPSVRDGNDGPWSSFNIVIGQPGQRLRLLPSTSSTTLMPFSVEDCALNPPSVSCNVSNGQFFNLHNSNSFQRLGLSRLPLYPLPIMEDPSFFAGNATYGRDIMSVQTSRSLLNGTPIAAMLNVTGFSTGMFGVFPNDMSISKVTIPSLTHILESNGIINSNSWSYTAGSVSMNQTGSFIFGGYDQSRIDTAKMVVVTRNLSSTGDAYPSSIYVSVQSITDDATQGESLLPPPSPINMQISTDVPQIWVPFTVCKSFEKVYGLKWNAVHNLFLLDNETYTELSGRTSSLQFVIGADASSSFNDLVTFTIPWLLMILRINIDGVETPYVPLRCTNDTREYTLGRSFLQAAYLIADFDSGVMKLGQIDFSGHQKLPDIKSIRSQNKVLKNVRAIVGGVLGPTALMLAIISGFLIWRRRRTTNTVLTSSELLHDSFKPELAATPVDAPPAYRRRHSNNVTMRSEVDAVSTMLAPRLDTLSEDDEPAEKRRAQTIPVELEATPARASELYAGYEGVEMKAEASPRDGSTPQRPHFDSTRNEMDEPISPLHEAEASRSDNENGRLSRSDL